MKDYIYEDDFIVLRKGVAEDAEGMYELLNDSEVMRYYGESATDMASAKAEIDWFNSLFDKHAGRWVIADKKTGKCVGDIGVFNYNPKHKKGEVGFKLKPSYWGKGIMSRCTHFVLNYCFSELDYNRIEGLVDVRNSACKSLLRKTGFVKEGVLRDYEFEHGDFVDLEIHSVLKREFVNKK